MLISAYRPLSEAEPTFGAAKITDIVTVVSYSYSHKMAETGSFSLKIPVNVPGAELIVADTILHIDNQDCLIVRNVTETHEMYEIAGNDLKDFLTRRLTVFTQKEQDTGTYGHYVVKGSTEYCIKTYLDFNIVNPENAGRKIFGFSIAPDKGRGLKDDSYMSRLEPLDTIAGKMCGNAGLGYDVRIDIDNNRYRFDVYEPLDRTDGQTENLKTVFAIEFKNIKSITRVKGNTNEKNVIYAVNGGSEPYVETVYKGEPKGLSRIETTVNTSVDGYDENVVKMYALEAAKDMTETDTFEMEVGNINDYGVIYSLGDKVTFKYRNLWLDSVISEVIKEYSGESLNIKLVAGEKKPKLINSIIKSGKRTSGDLKETNLNNKVNPPVTDVKLGCGSYTIASKYGKETYQTAGGQNA